MWAISVTGDGRISSKTEIVFPHEPHTLFFGKMYFIFCCNSKINNYIYLWNIHQMFIYYHFPRVVKFWNNFDSLSATLFILCLYVCNSVSYFSHRRWLHFIQDWSCLPARATHTIFCHSSVVIDHGKCNGGIYDTTRLSRLFCENYISWKKRYLVSFILSIMRGGYNMKYKM